MNIQLIDRRLIVATTGGALALLAGLWIVPNYLSATDIRAHSQRLDAQTSEYLAQRSALEQLQAEVLILRSEAQSNCRSLPESPQDSQLVDALARPVDGLNLSDQVVRLGELELHPSASANGSPLERRRVRIEMLGSFDAVFSVLHAIDQERNVNRVTSVDIHPGAAGLSAVLEVDEYFSGPKEVAQ
ncbi:MAG: hypothetical protein EXS00_00195 [Phycisphaerales bacterium]|nr:hypothetical protein [Phycisphaerales bacterium]